MSEFRRGGVRLHRNRIVSLGKESGMFREPKVKRLPLAGNEQRCLEHSTVIQKSGCSHIPLQIVPDQTFRAVLQSFPLICPGGAAITMQDESILAYV